MGFGVWVFRFWGLVFGVWGLGFRVWGLVFGVWVWGVLFGVWCLGFGVWGCRIGVSGCGSRDSSFKSRDCDFIFQKGHLHLTESVYKDVFTSQFPYKFVNLFFVLVIVKNKVTNLCTN